MKLRYSKSDYFPYGRPGLNGPGYFCVFDRWMRMRRKNWLRDRGYKSFYLPAGVLWELTAEYTGWRNGCSQEAAARVAGEYKIAMFFVGQARLARQRSAITNEEA